MASDSSSATMDEFLEILNLPSWSDIGGLRNQLEFNSASSSAPELGALPNSVEDSSKQLMLSDLQLPEAQGGASQQVGEFMDSVFQPFHHESQLQLPLQGINCNSGGFHSSSSSFPSSSSFASLLQPQLDSSSSIVSNSAGFYDLNSRVPYIGDLQQQLLKPEVFLPSGGSNHVNPLDPTRYRSPGALPSSLRQSLHRGVFSSYGLNHQKPPLQTSSRGAYRNTQPAPMAPASGAPRPRVRARRGQATDPHSIAERQRRERIAERMKNLQGLVPNVNKTDKAIMLDEIIEYVKFLQLQHKIFSMCRMGSSGSVPCNLPPSEHSSALAANLGQSNGTSAEALVNLERQVARMMDESMGSALQFLQSKGFCLMPVSMAAALSATKAVHQPIYSGDKSETSTIVTAEKI